MLTTINPRLFWVSAVLLLICLNLAPVLTRKPRLKSPLGRVGAIALLVLGVCIVPVLCWPLTRGKYGAQTLPELFGWFCLHGMIAVLFLRMDFTIISALLRRDQTRRTKGERSNPGTARSDTTR